MWCDAIHYTQSSTEAQIRASCLLLIRNVLSRQLAVDLFVAMNKRAILLLYKHWIRLS